MLSYTNPASGQCGCECGSLPHTVTLAFSGFSNDNRTGYVIAGAQACFGFGSGGQIVIVAPGGDPETDRGPITEVLLTSPGRCYAEYGRVQPTLTVVGDGRGCQFTVSLQELTGTCNRKTWRIQSVAVAGGEGYTDFSLLKVLPAAGDIVTTPAVLRVRSTNGVPTSVQITNGGVYYREVKSERDVPVLSIDRQGCGALFSCNVQPIPDTDPPAWEVASVSIDYAGDKCAAGLLTFKAGDLTTNEQAAAAAFTVNADGLVDSVTLTNRGRYYRDYSNVSPNVAAVTFSPPGGSGAVIRGVIDQDIASETFGEIASVVIENGGTDYLGWQHLPGCLEALNGQSVVLRAVDPKELVRACARPTFGTPPSLVIDTSKYDGVPGPLLDVSIAPSVGGPLAGSGMARKGRVAPTFTAKAFPGSGATFSVQSTKSQDENGFDFWEVSKITASGGSGYVDGDQEIVTVAAQDSVEESPRFRLWTRIEPLPTLQVVEPEGFEGEQAQLTAVMERVPGFPPAWTIASVEIDDPGTEYPWLSEITVTVTDPDQQVQAAALRAYADQAGKVTAVSVEYGGQFYRRVGYPAEVEVLTAGVAYRESDTEQPYVADVPVVIEQIAPSDGNGAEVVVQIDKSPTSPTFGQATSVSLTNSGSGYALLGEPRDCRYAVECGAGSLHLTLRGNADILRPFTTVETSGRNRGLQATFVSGVSSDSVIPRLPRGIFFGPTGVIDCDLLDQTLPAKYDVAGGQVAVTAGGRYEGPRGYCCRGCQCDPEDFSGIASVSVSISFSAATCGINAAETLVLNQGNNWSAQQAINDDGASVEASLGCASGKFFNLNAGVFWGLSCNPLPCGGFIIGSARSLRMLPLTVDGKCVPVGFNNWTWQQSNGDEYVLYERGNEILQACNGLSVTVSASVALA